jgi:transcriptional regulator with XRE-family HTH domain
MVASLHTPKYKFFRSILVKAREVACLTQIEVATKLGKPQSFVAKYEGGERRLDIVEFLQVCIALNISPHVVIDEMQEKEESWV